MGAVAVVVTRGHCWGGSVGDEDGHEVGGQGGCKGGGTVVLMFDN